MRLNSRFRTLAGSFVTGAFAVGTLVVAAEARAGTIADENRRPGTDAWMVDVDGTAATDGAIDVYPARWSIAQGESIALKVRSTTPYDARVFRIGWYGGAGGTEIAFRTGNPADPQPYPIADATFGDAAARWHDSLAFTTDATWTPGVYVVRLTQTTGEQAETFFVVRDDALPTRTPILFVLPTATHEAYNAWPRADRGGKSLYGFDSSDVVPGDSDLNQAVKVSFDRPFLAFAGLADLPNDEIPYLRFLERNGWDVAYCTDQDLHENHGIALGRKVITGAGHWEYWSREMFDHALAARDAGTDFLFLTGDTLSWQIRFEDGTRTIVGYKESYPRDPEQIAAVRARDAGDIAGARAHFANVTRAWKSLEWDPDHGIDVRRPGMLLTGVQSAAIVRDASGAEKDTFPWADLQIDAPDHWIFEGTGAKAGDRIAGVMGYEIDSLMSDDPSFDPFRPEGQRRLGTIVQDSDGAKRGSSGYYRAASGAEVVAIGAIAFSWSLDDFAMKNAGYSWTSVDRRAQRMVTNALSRWTGAAPATDPASDGSAGSDGSDAGTTADDPSGSSGSSDEADVGDRGSTENSSAISDRRPIASAGCDVGARGTPLAPTSIFLAAAPLLARLRRRRAR